MRLDSSPSIAVHPKSGMKIEVAGNDGDVAVVIEGAWIKVFRYFEGEIRCKLSPEMLRNPKDPIAKAALALARRLGGQIIDDDGNSLEMSGLGGTP